MFTVFNMKYVYFMCEVCFGRMVYEYWDSIWHLLEMFVLLGCNAEFCSDIDSPQNRDALHICT